MSGRVYERKFDWDEARARYAAGEEVANLAREYGVTWAAVARVVREDVRARMDAARDRWGKASRCPDCGAPTTRHRRTDSKRCRACAAIAAATTVRPDELRCVTCREWKPDDQFPKNQHEKARRGRHRQCRVCQTIARREHRRRNRDKQLAYERAYQARRRAQERQAA